MVKKIELKKKPIKSFKIPYELFPTETGDCKPTIVQLYNDCIYLKYNIFVEFKAFDEDNKAVDSTFSMNKATYLTKNLIEEIVIEDNELVQSDIDGNPKNYNRPRIDINLVSGTGYQLWFETYPEAIEMLNELTNWKYNEV